MKQKKNSAWQSFVRSLWVPAPYNSDQSHIMITGRSKISIDQAASILAYEEDKILLRLKTCRLAVEGEDLLIEVYTDKNVTISGTFRTISFE